MISFRNCKIIYDDELRFPAVFVESFIPQREFLPDYIIFEGQSMYDLAVQLYGDVDQGLKELTPILKSISQGTVITRKVPTSNIGEIFNDNNVLVATDDVVTIPLPPGVGLEYEIEFELEG